MKTITLYVAPMFSLLLLAGSACSKPGRAGTTPATTPATNPTVVYRLYLGTDAQTFQEDAGFAGGGEAKGVATIYCNGDPIAQYAGNISVINIENWAKRGDNAIWIDNHTDKAVYAKVVRQVGGKPVVVGKQAYPAGGEPGPNLNIPSASDAGISSLEAVPADEESRKAARNEMEASVQRLVRAARARDGKAVVSQSLKGDNRRLRCLEGRVATDAEVAEAEKVLSRKDGQFVEAAAEGDLEYIFGVHTVMVGRHNPTDGPLKPIFRFQWDEYASTKMGPIHFIRLEGQWVID